MDKLNELSQFLGEKIEEMNSIYPFMAKDSMYTINYVDNQGQPKSKSVDANCFGAAVIKVEDYANEQGHGVKHLRVSVRVGE